MNRQRTIFFTFPMQAIITLGIKTPILKAMEVRKLKAIWYLWKAFRTLSKLPEPTIENTWHPNTHKLILLRDWLLDNIQLSDGRKEIIWRIMNFGIIIYDFDPPWRWIIDSVREKILNIDWEKRGYGDRRNYDWWQEK